MGLRIKRIRLRGGPTFWDVFIRDNYGTRWNVGTHTRLRDAVMLAWEVWRLYRRIVRVSGIPKGMAWRGAAAGRKWR